jgi:predicted ATPase
MSPGTSYGLPGTLPRQTSGFVGRAAELVRLRELLHTSRLVTVTGAAGVGKTRLAVRVASEPAGGFRDGTYLVDLSAIDDPAGLAPAVAARLAAPAPAGGTGLAGSTGLDARLAREAPLAAEALLTFVRDRELLLILDTCEHLIDACAALADALLRESPGVTILATSRQPLDAAGEAVLQLGPLPVRTEAVELFAQRATAAVPGFTVTQDNLADIVAVCRRLDGIPLAIELATVRLRALPLHEMAGRIDDRLRLLTGGRRSVTPRHQTLRAAIEWSYTLCTPAERTLWARLSVFAGPFDLTAAEAVCAGGMLGPGEVAPVLLSLVDKSVVTRRNGQRASTHSTGLASDAHPFRLLGATREFGTERLRATDGPAEAIVRSRYIAYYLELAEQFDRMPGAGQLEHGLRVCFQHTNLQAALDYALATEGNDGAAIVLASSLAFYWRGAGLLREGEYWLDRVLERCPVGSIARARVQATRAYLRVLRGDFDGGRADADAAIRVAAVFGDVAVTSRAACARYRALTFTGYLAEAEVAGSAAARFFASVGDVSGLARLAAVDAAGQLQAAEPRRCHEIAAAALARLPDGEARCTSELLSLQSVGLFLCGDFTAARAAAHRGLALKRDLHDVVGIAFALGGLAFIAAGEGRAERVAWLFGASAPLWEQVGRWYTGTPAFEALHRVAERAATTSLGEDRFWRLHGTASAAPLGHVINQALADADQLGEPGAGSTTDGRLVGRRS